MCIVQSHNCLTPALSCKFFYVLWIFNFTLYHQRRILKENYQFLVIKVKWPESFLKYFFNFQHTTILSQLWGIHSDRLSNPSLAKLFTNANALTSASATAIFNTNEQFHHPIATLTITAILQFTFNKSIWLYNNGDTDYNNNIASRCDEW